MKKGLWIGLMAIAVVFMGITASYAGEIDLLLNKLVEKGVLSAGEAQELKTETQEQVKAEISQGKSATLPAWIQNTKLKGDFRLRYQLDHTQASTATQNRARIRMRLGLESKVNDKLNVGIGLATGQNDFKGAKIDKDFARSTNQTLGDSFSKHPIGLDYAYAQYLPTPWATITGGKFKNLLWEPGDLIWDTDINPEGGGLQLSKGLNSKTKLFLNTGVYILSESSGQNSDPTMYFIQPGVTFDATDKISLKSAVSYYGTSNVKGRALQGSAGTNTGVGVDSDSVVTGALRKNYDTLTPAMELSFREPFKALDVGFLDIPWLSLFGEYVNNPQFDTANTGYMTGIKFGAEKIANRGDWQFQYNYAMLGKDAVLDILPDSDRFGGKTQMRSHEGILQYGLGKNTYLSLDYYYGWKIGVPTHHAPAQVVQADWNLKF